MARVWMEGFEDGLPHGHFLEGNPNFEWIRGLTFSGGLTNGSFPGNITMSTGRNVYSQKSLKIHVGGGTYANYVITKVLDSELTELYLRVWVNLHITETGTDTAEVLWLEDVSNNKLLSIFSNGSTSFAVKVKVAGSYASVGDFVISDGAWHKLDIYIKIDATTGAYNVKLDNASMYSATDVNTGAVGVSIVRMGCAAGYATNVNAYDMYFDDIALNDATGSVNNSWCGDGTIVPLRPKAAGNKSQWDTVQGWALAEDATTTENIEITGHGLATNDVIYNVTRNAYRIVTKTDDNNLAVTAITGQVEGDTIIMFAYAATIAAGTGTDTSHVVLSGHTLETYEVFVNTSRSNAIRRVIYVDGTSVYNYSVVNTDYTGSTVASQAVSDSIKTFKVHPYTLSDHYLAVNTVNPNPQYSNIQSGTASDIDTFDMQELVADLGLPANTGIIAVSNNIFAKEKGAGSQIKSVLRISGSDYESSAISIIGGTKEYQTVYSVSPASSAAWTKDEIEAIECGVEVV